MTMRPLGIHARQPEWLPLRTERPVDDTGCPVSSPGFSNDLSYLGLWPGWIRGNGPLGQAGVDADAEVDVAPGRAGGAHGGMQTIVAFAADHRIGAPQAERAI